MSEPEPTQRSESDAGVVRRAEAGTGETAEAVEGTNAVETAAGGRAGRAVESLETVDSGAGRPRPSGATGPTSPAGTSPQPSAPNAPTVPNAPSATCPPAARRASVRLGVLKTYKLYIGGKFPRSESGRVYEVTDTTGNWLANAPRASRKDARDAVAAARKAFGGWSGATAYNRGQILYRIAEMLEGRREQFVREVGDAEGLDPHRAAAQVDAAIDRWVWYAGWTDKVAQVVGGGNPVAGPFFNLSTPEPTGVVAVVAPQKPSFLGLVSVTAPVVATGNTTVVVASERSPLPALSLAEVLATSDLPGGVVNLLSGRTAEIAAPLAAHQDVNAIDLAGADSALAKDLEIAAADNLKRVVRPPAAAAVDYAADPGIERLTAFLETKTVWHPTGALGVSGSSY